MAGVRRSDVRNDAAFRALEELSQTATIIYERAQTAQSQVVDAEVPDDNMLVQLMIQAAVREVPDLKTHLRRYDYTECMRVTSAVTGTPQFMDHRTATMFQPGMESMCMLHRWFITELGVFVNVRALMVANPEAQSMLEMPPAYVQNERMYETLCIQNATAREIEAERAAKAADDFDIDASDNASDDGTLAHLPGLHIDMSGVSKDSIRSMDIKSLVRLDAPAMPSMGDTDARVQAELKRAAERRSAMDRGTVTRDVEDHMARYRSHQKRDGSDMRMPTDADLLRRARAERKALVELQDSKGASGAGGRGFRGGARGGAGGAGAGPEDLSPPRRLGKPLLAATVPAGVIDKAEMERIRRQVSKRRR
jgi:hypothetical protein